jgi:hypothetical protein
MPSEVTTAISRGRSHLLLKLKLVMTHIQTFVSCGDYTFEGLRRVVVVGQQPWRLWKQKLLVARSGYIMKLKLSVAIAHKKTRVAAVTKRKTEPTKTYISATGMDFQTKSSQLQIETRIATSLQMNHTSLSKIT